MIPVLKKLGVNLLLAGVSLILILAVLELVVFRFILLPSDIPSPEFVDGVIKYAPNQRGTTRIRNEIRSPYRINEDGWNSGHSDYVSKRGPKTRIAVIGDSYVEARQVRYDDSMAEKLERLLGEEEFEVYRFAISGAPLSQYLHLVRHEVATYSPDVVVVVLIHNDFTDSYRFKAGVYASSFLKLRVEDGVVTREIPPERYEKRWYSSIRSGSATWRYLAYRQQIRFKLLRQVILGRDKPRPEAQSPSAGPSASRARDRQAGDRGVTEYVLGSLREEAYACGTRLLLLMDASRSQVYADRDVPSNANWLNAMAADVASSVGIDFVDLRDAFAADFAKHGERFEFQHDAHWNDRGHQVAATVAAEWIGSSLEISGGRKLYRCGGRELHTWRRG